MIVRQLSCCVMCALSDPTYLGNTVDDSRVHEIEQQIRVSYHIIIDIQISGS